LEIQTGKWNGYFFNAFSSRDRATGRLFPAASWFTTDGKTRAIGAAALGDYPKHEASESGHVKWSEPPAQKVWNIDASRIIFDHNDIYKGRVATMLNELLSSVGPPARNLATRTLS
jgi:hypothetical protein